MEAHEVRNSGWSVALWHAATGPEAPDVEVTAAETGEPWLHVTTEETTLVIGPAGPASGDHVHFAQRLARAAEDYAYKVQLWWEAQPASNQEPQR